MGYNGQSCESIEEQYKKTWMKKRFLRIKLLSKDKKALVSEIIGYSLFHQEHTILDKIEREYQEGVTIRAYIQKSFDNVTKLFVPKEYQDDYYHIIDKYNT